MFRLRKAASNPSSNRTRNAEVPAAVNDIDGTGDPDELRSWKRCPACTKPTICRGRFNGNPDALMVASTWVADWPCEPAASGTDTRMFAIRTRRWPLPGGLIGTPENTR